MAAFLILVVLAANLATVTGFYLPGVAPHSFTKDENVDLKVNKLRYQKTIANVFIFLSWELKLSWKCPGMSWRRKGLQLPAKLWRWWIILRTIATIYHHWQHVFPSWYLFLQFSTHATAIWLLFPKVLPTRRYARTFSIDCTIHYCKSLLAHIDLGKFYRKNTTPPCDFLLETRTEILFFCRHIDSTFYLNFNFLNVIKCYSVTFIKLHTELSMIL